MTKHEAIPCWIHGLEEYEQMFDLQADDYRKILFDFPGSISSFNADVYQQAHRIVSGDTIYSMDFPAMQAYVEQLLQSNYAYLKQHAQAVLRHGVADIESIFKIVQDNSERFLTDYVTGKKQARYQAVFMPHLPYKNHEFQLALCCDYVFNHHKQNDCTPQEVVFELCRIAEEVRIFPVLTERGEPSTWLGPLMLELQQRHYGIEVRHVAFKNVKGNNAMLRIWALECVVE